ncbi:MULTISPECIES: PQQ-binding-like beta-propeller repeat protein [unclassified Brachybacterium]|uniref:outer membrane protein assembly factor BamB family protein n=1 Tax=unclassified Brachybacterium TaxID=2623841 RepID=UPI003613BFC7
MPSPESYDAPLPSSPASSSAPSSSGRSSLAPSSLPRSSRARSSAVTARPLGRRTVLGAAAVSAGAAGLASAGLTTVRADAAGPALPATGAGAEGPADGESQVFAAFLTDVHIDSIPQQQEEHLRLVLEDIRASGAPLLLHGGDLTEFGSSGEYETYQDLLGPDAAEITQHVAGNHELRWDPSAGQEYRRRFHEGSRSFDHLGVHVIMLEAGAPLQEEAHVDPAALAWLREDLQAAGTMPSILVMHWPPGADDHYVRAGDQLLSVLAEHPVRLVLAGHVHREATVTDNGTVLITGRAIKNEPVHYLLTLRGGPEPEAREMLVEAITQPAPGAEGDRTVEEIASIPLHLGTARESDAFLQDVSVHVSGDTAQVTARLGAPHSLTAARAQLRDQSVYGSVAEGTWSELELRGRRVRGELDLSQTLPGRCTMRVRGVDEAGGLWEASAPFSVEGGSVTEVDALELDGAVSGAILPVGEDSALVATGSGTVARLSLDRSRLSTDWSVGVGGVHRGMALSADGSVLHVPSADHHLYALSVTDGTELWRADLGLPVVSTPLATAVDGAAAVFVSAGDRLARLAADGSTVWSTAIPQQSSGRPALVGDRLVLGAGDGTARCYSARTGAEIWSAELTTRTTPYQRLLYGPWNCTVLAVDESTVVLGTVTDLFALDAATGEQRWRTAAGAMYSAPQLLEDGRILAVQERKEPLLIDAADGAATPLDRALQISLDADPIPGPSAGTWLQVSFSAVLSLLDTAAGTVTPLRQVGPDRVLAAPALLEGHGVVLVGDQAGVVRALDVLDVSAV